MLIRSLLLLLFGFLLADGLALAADTDYAAAINQAGRQRMLTQRIVKAYCQLGLGVTPEASKAQLKESVALFERQLAALKPMATSKEMRETAAQIDRLWGPLKSVANGPVHRAGAQQLMGSSEELLRAADQLTKLLEGQSGSPIGRLVNISGRQRMVSQRLAKLYMLQAWGFDSPQLRSDMSAAAALFATALAELQQAPQNTDAIRAQLEAVSIQWEWFRHALELQGEESFRQLVADASESILRSLEMITALYQERGSN